MTASRPLRLYLFETNTLLFWAEEVAGEAGIPVEVVPAPEGAEDICGLALRTWADRGEKLESLMEKDGIPFRVHS